MTVMNDPLELCETELMSAVMFPLERNDCSGNSMRYERSHGNG